MSIVPSASTAPGVAAPPAPATEFFRWSVDQYHEILRAGILSEDDPVELLEGYLVTKTPANPPHNHVMDATREGLAGLSPSGWWVRMRLAVTTDTSEPEPDVSVTRGKRSDYRGRHPGPKDVALLVEVSDSSLSRDRGSKKRLYARARIPVYWIINLSERQVEVYSEPSGPAENPDYSRCDIYNFSDPVPAILDGQEVGRLVIQDLLF